MVNTAPVKQKGLDRMWGIKYLTAILLAVISVLIVVTLWLTREDQSRMILSAQRADFSGPYQYWLEDVSHSRRIILPDHPCLYNLVHRKGLPRHPSDRSQWAAKVWFTIQNRTMVIGDKSFDSACALQSP